jgi:acetoacetyl-CoA synthetase
VTAFPTIQDSLAVGQKTADDERVILFIKMVPNIDFTEKLVNDIKSKIRSLLSARHVPAVILPIADIPVIYLLDLVYFDW